MGVSHLVEKALGAPGECILPLSLIKTPMNDWATPQPSLCSLEAKCTVTCLTPEFPWLAETKFHTVTHLPWLEHSEHALASLRYAMNFLPTALK